MNIFCNPRVKGHMQRKLLLLALALPYFFLGSCTNVHYRPLTNRPQDSWQGSSALWGGYTETKHSEGNYSIGFESYNRPTPEATAYFTLVRAAERAAIDGKSTFYLKTPPVQTSKQNSYFSSYIVPGYTEVETVVRKEVDCHGHVHHHTQEYIIRHPDTYVPPHNVTNAIHKSAYQLSYDKRISAPYDTFSVLNEAQRNTLGYGKPKLDPRAKAQMKAWAKR